MIKARISIGDDCNFILRVLSENRAIAECPCDLTFAREKVVGVAICDFGTSWDRISCETCDRIAKRGFTIVFGSRWT